MPSSRWFPTLFVLAAIPVAIWVPAGWWQTVALLSVVLLARICGALGPPSSRIQLHRLLWLFPVTWALIAVGNVVPAQAEYVVHVLGLGLFCHFFALRADAPATGSRRSADRVRRTRARPAGAQGP